MRKSLFKTAFIIFLIAGCKKYPDGGNSMFMKSKMRGTYTLEKEIINGVDSTSEMKTLCGNSVRIWEDFDDFIAVEAGSRGQFIMSGDRTRVIYDMDTRYGSNPKLSIFRHSSELFYIKKFKRGQFWLQSDDGNLYIELKCKK
ncbi:MAG: hypothetical protein ACHQF2_07220 [Flavobacteriales bacterium]